MFNSTLDNSEKAPRKPPHEATISKIQAGCAIIQAMQWFFRQFARLPLSWLHALGIATGWLVYWSSPGYAARMRENLSRSGLCTSPETCRQLRHQAIAEAGKSVLELPGSMAEAL